MSRIIYPINNKEYTAEDVEIANCTRTSGVHSVLDFDCSLNGNVLTVGKGLGWIKNGDFSGKTVAFTEPETFTLDGADSALDRYDVVAVRYDATKKEPEIVIIKGEARETAVMPKRNTESYLYELFLYAILRKAGESTASFENVTDLRENKNYCGIMEDSVTSAVAPVYETIYEGAGLQVGNTVDFDYSKYAFLIASVHSTVADVDVVLNNTVSSVTLNTFSGSNSVVVGEDGTLFFRAQIKLNENSATGHTITVATYGTSDNISAGGTLGGSYITKIIGVTKQPKGYVAVDDIYNPESHNAQSGEAVKQAIEEALEGFEPPEQDMGSGVSEAQRQTLMAVVNAIGLFSVPNAQELLDNFNKAWNTVDPVPATSITLDKTEITFTSEEPQTISAVVLPANTTDVVVWTSSNTSIATVKNGVITPLNDGETVITATARNVSATCAVTVNIYGEIENPVFLQMGYAGWGSTATSEPVTNDEYPETASFSAVPVKKGDTLVCKTNIVSPKNWLQFFIFGADGSKGTMIYSTEALGWDTVVATQDGFIRTNIIGQASNHNGTIAEVSEYSVTSQGIKTTYTVVDKR